MVQKKVKRNKKHSLDIYKKVKQYFLTGLQNRSSLRDHGSQNLSFVLNTCTKKLFICNFLAASISFELRLKKVKGNYWKTVSV